MKYSSRILSLLILVSMTVFFAGCDKGEDNKKSKKDQQIAKLVGTWNFQSGTFDGELEGYDDFTLVIDGDAGDDVLTYDASGRPAGKGPWPMGGDLSFGADVLHDLIRDEGSADELEMTYTVTDNSLTIEFDFTGTGYEGDGARTENIEGTWVFNFTK